MDKDELETLEIQTSNNYVGAIISARWKSYLDAYEVVVEFDSEEELKQFCDMYSYKVSRLGDSSMLVHE